MYSISRQLKKVSTIYSKDTASIYSIRINLAIMLYKLLYLGTYPHMAPLLQSFHRNHYHYSMQQLSCAIVIVHSDGCCRWWPSQWECPIPPPPASSLHIGSVGGSTEEHATARDCRSCRPGIRWSRRRSAEVEPGSRSGCCCCPFLVRALSMTS